MRLTFWVALLWIAGLLTLVPYSIYRLLFQASREEYAFLIVLPLFWVFGYWGAAGPLIAAWRVHTLMGALEAARGSEEIRAAFERHEGEDVVKRSRRGSRLNPSAAAGGRCGTLRSDRERVSAAEVPRAARLCTGGATAPPVVAQTFRACLFECCTVGARPAAESHRSTLPELGEIR